MVDKSVEVEIASVQHQSSGLGEHFELQLRLPSGHRSARTTQMSTVFLGKTQVLPCNPRHPFPSFLPGGSAGKESGFAVCSLHLRLPTMRETWVQSLGQEDPLEKELVTRSSILSWRIPWTEAPGGLPGPWGRKELDMTE